MWAKSFTVRAVLAILFLVLFYAVAVGIAVALLAIPYWEVKAAHRIHIKLVILCVVGAGVILWSLVPRFSRFEPPGPQVRETDHPKLFGLIRDVAAKMGQPVPAEVYLVPEVNAFVTTRGGFLGLGSRRVMGIGVPLLAVQNVSQFQAVLAHEFGHYAGGETRLGGLIFATRGAMIRTLVNLESGGSSILSKPFEWMLKTYMAITQAISRQQELLADACAVRVAGKEAHVSGLKQVGLQGTGFSLFMKQEVGPLAELGVSPDNYFEGFRRYVKSSAWRELEPRVAQALSEEQPDPYDSHPSLEDRLAHAEGLTGAAHAMDTTPAYTLLSNPDVLEQRFSDALRPKESKVVAWSDIGPAWSKTWKESAARAQSRIPELTLGRALELVRTPAAQEEVAERLEPRLIGFRLPDRPSRLKDTLERSLSAYLGCLVEARGYGWESAPGEAIKLVKDGDAINMVEHVQKAMEGAEGLQSLEQLFQRLGVDAAAALPVTEQERAQHTAVRCAVTVVQEKGHALVSGPLDGLFLPRCCPLCCGEGLVGRHVTKQVEGMFSGDDTLSFQLLFCEAHAPKADSALAVKAVDKSSGAVTLRFTHPAYGELVRRASA